MGSPEVFSRVYHKLADEFPEVYDSPDLAGYVRLLVAADQAWPASARWAGLVTKSCLARLVASSLIVRDGSRYRIRGLDKERQARSDVAKHAINKRWEYSRNTGSNTTRSTDVIPRTEQKRKEESKENLRERPIARPRDNGDLEPVAAIIPRVVKP